MKHIKCSNCQSNLGSIDLNGAIKIDSKRVNHHEEISITENGITLKCRTCSSLVNITSKGAQVNEKATNRAILDKFSGGRKQMK